MGPNSELEELRARERALTQFVALAAHELRAPATVMHGIAATLAGRPAELTGERGELLVQTLYDQSLGLVTLLDQLLDLSRLDGAAPRVVTRRLAVRQHVLGLVASVAGDRAAEVDVTVDRGLEAVLDPAILDRIVGNLVTNALRHGESPVRVTAEQADRHFRLVVEDCGAGVDPELRPRLFDRFVSGPDAAGSGLGLAIARSFAHAHGGSLLYEPGRPGARFRLVIPTAPAA